jgi:hypothetical protein
MKAAARGSINKESGSFDVAENGGRPVSSIAVS